MSGLRGRIADAVAGATGTVVILSENPIHDTGGGQRSAQLALELLERGHCVVFVSRGVVTETVDLRLRFPQPRLVRVGLDELLAQGGSEALAPALTAPGAWVLTQIAVEPWRPVIEAARTVGGPTVYDCVDRWATEHGRGWYDVSVERSIAGASDALTATAPELVEHVERITGRQTRLVPNAFSPSVFDAARSWPRPADLPAERRVVLFVGAMWGSWIDWGLVRRAADALPGASFVFVGDRKRVPRRLPDNCVFLGLKPQAALPAYLAHADVAHLPWRVDDVTRAASPLTVFEHVAMGLPVVAPSTEPLRGIPGIVEAADADAFVEALRSAGRATLDAQTRSAMADFAERNTWAQRVDDLLDVVARARSERLPSGPAVRTRTHLSVVIPSYNHDRYIGEAVDSVRDQTLPAGELVVVDDGSSDASLELLDQHAFPGMRVVAQQNRGAHAAINRAIALTSGDWIAILDSDDAFEPERLEHAWAVARTRGAALVFGSVRLIDEAGAPLAPDHPTAVWYRGARADADVEVPATEVVREHNLAMTTSNFLVHRALWEQLGGFAAYRYVHDYDFLLRALAVCPRRVVYAPELSDVRYRIHASNTIAESTERALAERAAMLRTLRHPVRRARATLARLRSGPAVGAAVDASPIVAPRAPARAAAGPDVRVGIVVRSLGTGGLEEVVALLAQSLPGEGADVSVLCTDAGGATAERLRRAGVEVTVGDGSARAWRDWHARARPEVLSTHFVGEDVFEALAPLGPIVDTVHNTYAWLESAEWEALARQRRAVAATIAVSELAARHWLDRVGAAEARLSAGFEPGSAPPVHVVGNAVHPARAARVPRTYARREIGIAADVPLFIHLGRVTSQKNLDGLLGAFTDALPEMPDARLLLVGPTDDRAPLAGLQRTHRPLFRAGSVRRLPPCEVVGVVLSAADALVSSSFYEGWSVSASEALWVGTPVVLADCGGARELAGSPGDQRGFVVANPLGDPLAASPELLASPPSGPLTQHRRELATVLARFAAGRPADVAPEHEIRAWARRHLAPSRLAADYARILRSVARR